MPIGGVREVGCGLETAEIKPWGGSHLKIKPLFLSLEIHRSSMRWWDLLFSWEFLN